MKNKLTSMAHEYPVLATVGADIYIDPTVLCGDDLVSVRDGLKLFRDYEDSPWDAPVFPLTQCFQIHVEYGIALDDGGGLAEDTYAEVLYEDESDTLPDSKEAFIGLSDMFEFVGLCERISKKSRCRLNVDYDFFSDEDVICEYFDWEDEIEPILDKMVEEYERSFLDLARIYRSMYGDLLKR